MMVCMLFFFHLVLHDHLEVNGTILANLEPFCSLLRHLVEIERNFVFNFERMIVGMRVKNLSNNRIMVTTITKIKSEEVVASSGSSKKAAAACSRCRTTYRISKCVIRCRKLPKKIVTWRDRVSLDRCRTNRSSDRSSERYLDRSSDRSCSDCRSSTTDNNNSERSSSDCSSATGQSTKSP